MDGYLVQADGNSFRAYRLFFQADIQLLQNPTTVSATGLRAGFVALGGWIVVFGGGFVAFVCGIVALS